MPSRLGRLHLSQSTYQLVAQLQNLAHVSKGSQIAAQAGPLAEGPQIAARAEPLAGPG